MLENLQQMILENVLQSKPQRSYQGDFHANPTALQANVWELMMNVIYGMSYSVSFARLAPNGLWQKMYRGYYQLSMDNFLEMYCGTWPKEGVMRGGTVFQPMLQGLNISVNEYALWPRPIASDGEAWLKNKYVNKEWTLYVVEDISGADVSPYHYEINFIPETIIPFEFEIGA